MKRRPPHLFLVWFVFLLALTAGVCLFIGPTGWGDANILLRIRFPRVLLGLVVGMGLGAAGAVFQGLFRNPLVDPYILGTSNGATLGALVGLTLRSALPGSAFLSTLSFYIFIFLGALSATLLTYLIARTEKQVSVVNLLLSGIIVSTFLGALILLFFALQHQDSFSLFFFLMGSLLEGNLRLIAISGALILCGLLLSLLFARDLNILSLGEEKARSLGIELERLKLVLFVLGSLMVSAAVAVSGAIGFVGLIVPHMTRLIVGPNNRILIPASALLGATLLLITDTLARTVANPIEIPVGILTALMGAPFFLWLLRRRRKERYF